MYSATASNPADPVTRSRSPLAGPAHFHQALAAKLNAYKAGLLEQFSNEPEAFLHFARLAVAEAESLAWSTPYAHWFLPTLAEEKIRYARQWAGRQYRVGSGLAVVATTTGPEGIRGNERAGSPHQTL